jgi:hypothetical protein
MKEVLHMTGKWKLQERKSGVLQCIEYGFQSNSVTVNDGIQQS